MARAAVAAAHQRGLVLPDAEGFSSTPGRGVAATVEGRVVRVGSPALLTEANSPRPYQDRGLLAEVGTTVAQLQADGHTAAVVLLDGAPAGVLGA